MSSSSSRRSSDASSHHANDEETPLIRQSTRSSDSDSTTKYDDNFWTYVKLYTLLLFVAGSYMIIAPARIRIFEQIYCDEYYRNHPTIQLPYHGPIPEEMCKVTEVQKQVSSLRGWYEFYDSLPTLVMAIPFGILSDIFGRRLLLINNLINLTLGQIFISLVTLFPDVVPIRAIWFQALFNFIGGGDVVAEMLFMCIITDITPQTKLANTFFLLSAMNAFTQVLGPSIGAILMKKSAWLAVAVGTAGMVISVFITPTLPETLQYKQEDIIEDTEELKRETVWERLKTATTITKKAFRELAIVWTDWRLIFVCVLLMPFRMLAVTLKDLLQRYVSNRYGWTIADGTFLYALQALSCAIVLFAILTPISDYIDKHWNITAVFKNVILTRAGLLMLFFGIAIEGFSPNVTSFTFGLIIETFGAGVSSTTRALAGTLVEQKDNGRVFSVLAISEVLSKMATFPAINSLFNMGMDRGGGMWLGLPYFASAGAALVAFLSMCAFRFERRAVIIE